jgi:hypothetical protein
VREGYFVSVEHLVRRRTTAGGVQTLCSQLFLNCCLLILRDLIWNPGSIADAELSRSSPRTRYAVVTFRQGCLDELFLLGSQSAGVHVLTLLSKSGRCFSSCYPPTNPRLANFRALNSIFGHTFDITARRTVPSSRFSRTPQKSSALKPKPRWQFNCN